jgi:hypothetical protein
MVSQTYDAVLDHSSVTWSFQNLVVRDDAGIEVMLNYAGVTIDRDVSGAGGLDTGSWTTGWYYIYVIYNKTMGLVSGIATATPFVKPTMPTGYTFYRYVGAIYCFYSSEYLFRNSKQYGDYIYYVPDGTYNIYIPYTESASPTESAWTAISIANYAPRTAKSIRVMIGVGAQCDYIGLSPHSSGWGGRYIKVMGGSSEAKTFGGIFHSSTALANCYTADIPIYFGSTDIYYYVKFNTTGTKHMSLHYIGYTDDLNMYY